ncbi:toxin-antitoxin system YwqK family antitoxin [Mesonia maritima]|uniref:Antitoxin component YwqK of YwqJK toxin-antitoxin module n=1 Tax=Mesonia maritima TaxID=1793873 RepID=A0ABU1K760_9FLAO|nr:toxin-antitoxin system YwqK family antitoxin [Mesonia maritima]MDR6301456.1 antitoxin component YwqK of YwqJK toxin-antitoxin module [Mesonia maritima]
MFVQKLNVFLLLFILITSSSFSQSEKINQFDKQGKRHGEWIKKYEGSDQIRYEGTFEHGKEIGTFKFYKPKSEDQPTATKTYFAEHDSVQVKFFTKKGELVSKGNMIDKKREGIWKYYFKDGNLMMQETYKNDVLNGWKIVYFPNGKITEKKHFENGVANGENLIYAKNGTLIQSYTYKDGKLHGSTETYNASGNLISEGNYKQGKRTGEWKFYKNNSLDEVKQY